MKSMEVLVLCLSAIALSAPAYGNSLEIAPSGATSRSPGLVEKSPEELPAPVDDTPPIGTVITIHNWRRYKRFMPNGMAEMFEGREFWKMPDDVAIEVGPTLIDQLPQNYLAATEKPERAVGIEELPDGGLNLTGYGGGMPFPHPEEPHKGWKILADLWFRYFPHRFVDSRGTMCMADASASAGCASYKLVINQLSYNTDPGVTHVGEGHKFITSWLMLLTPESQKYTTSLTINYSDLSEPEQRYVFIPALRRFLALSTAGRCSPVQGTDMTADDFRYGFDVNLTELRASYDGERKILTLLDPAFPRDEFPKDFDMPLGWPKPYGGRWQLRDVHVVDAVKIPSKAADYCYGKRVMYVDSRFYWGVC